MLIKWLRSTKKQAPAMIPPSLGEITKRENEIKERQNEIKERREYINRCINVNLCPNCGKNLEEKRRGLHLYVTCPNCNFSTQIFE